MSRRRRLFGNKWQGQFRSSSGVLASLVLDYNGATGGRFFDGTDNTLTFDDLHTFDRASIATLRDSSGFIVASSSGAHRLDHDKDGNRIGLLIEETRTNICLESNTLLTTWDIPTVLITPVQAITGPDGVSNSGWRIQTDTDGGSTQAQVNQIFTVDVSTQYVYSWFAKKDQLDWTAIRLVNFTTPSLSSAWWDLNNGVVGTKNAAITSIGMEDRGNGWHRCWATFTTDDTDTTGEIRILMTESDNFTGSDRDGTSSIFIFGAQLEKGALPSTYIPTTTAPVTRAAETCAFVVSDFAFDATKGAFVIEAGGDDSVLSENAGRFLSSNVDANVRPFRIDGASDGKVRAKVSADLDQVSTGTGSWQAGAKAAMAYDTTTLEVVMTGSAVETDTGTANFSGVTEFRIGSTGSASWINSHFQRIAWYPSKLPSADLTAFVV